MEAILQVIPWKEILTLIALVFYVESTVEIFGFLKRWRKDKVARTKLGVFLIAWIIVGVADYGVLIRIINVGVNAKQYFLPAVDYFCTAAFLTRLSGITYDQIETLKAKIDKAKQTAKEPPVVEKVTTTASTSEVTTQEIKKT